jgi:HAE1 family hydrophobic/amphiphilic exporter-1
LLVATGPGAEERRSIAILAVGGQTLSLLLTLLAVPVIYSYLDDLAALFHGRRVTDSAMHASLQIGWQRPAEPQA